MQPDKIEALTILPAQGGFIAVSGAAFSVGDCSYIKNGIKQVVSSDEFGPFLLKILRSMGPFHGEVSSFYDLPGSTFVTVQLADSGFIINKIRKTRGSYPAPDFVIDRSETPSVAFTVPDAVGVLLKTVQELTSTCSTPK